MKNIWLAVAGALSGILSGMGIGGGVLLIPVLTFLLDYEQRGAQSLNLIYFIPTAAVALFTHIKNKNIETKVLPWLIIIGAGGAIGGAMLAARIKGELLRKLFGGFMLLMAMVEFRKKE